MKRISKVSIIFLSVFLIGCGAEPSIEVELNGEKISVTETEYLKLYENNMKLIKQNDEIRKELEILSGNGMRTLGNADENIDGKQSDEPATFSAADIEGLQLDKMLLHDADGNLKSETSYGYEESGRRYFDLTNYYDSSSLVSRKRVFKSGDKGYVTSVAFEYDNGNSINRKYFRLYNDGNMIGYIYYDGPNPIESYTYSYNSTGDVIFYSCTKYENNRKSSYYEVEVTPVYDGAGSMVSKKEQRRYDDGSEHVYEYKYDANGYIIEYRYDGKINNTYENYYDPETEKITKKITYDSEENIYEYEEYFYE